MSLTGETPEINPFSNCRFTNHVLPKGAVWSCPFPRFKNPRKNVCGKVERKTNCRTRRVLFHHLVRGKEPWLFTIPYTLLRVYLWKASALANGANDDSQQVWKRVFAQEAQIRKDRRAGKVRITARACHWELRWSERKGLVEKRRSRTRLEMVQPLTGCKILGRGNEPRDWGDVKRRGQV